MGNFWTLAAASLLMMVRKSMITIVDGWPNGATHLKATSPAGRPKVVANDKSAKEPERVHWASDIDRNEARLLKDAKFKFREVGEFPLWEVCDGKIR